MQAKKIIYKPFYRTFHELSCYIRHFQNQNCGDFSFLSPSLLTVFIRLLESVVNSLFCGLHTSDELKTALERNLNLIVKLELLLFIRTQKQMDRSHHLFGFVKTMIKMRDSFTHPHPIESEFESFIINENGAIEFKSKQNPVAIKNDELFKMMNALFEFLDYYLIDLCNCDKELLASLLFESVIWDVGKVGNLQAIDLKKDKEIVEAFLKIKLRFLSFV